MSSLQESPKGLSVPPRLERRARYRRPFHNLAYVKLGDENGGILRDISDQGAALQAVAPLELGQAVALHFDLTGPAAATSRRRMDVEGQVAWCSPSGQAGVRFQNLGDSARRQLNEWIFAGILATITQFAPVLNSADPLEDENLRLAPAVRAPIALPIPLTAPRARQTPLGNDDDLLLDWVLDRISPRALSLTVDTLVLSVAALLFLVVALAVTKTLPGWMGSFVFAAGVFAFCTVFYRGMCRFLGMQTAGQWIAAHAVQARHSDHHAAWETGTRFR